MRKMKCFIYLFVVFSIIKKSACKKYCPLPLGEIKEHGDGLSAVGDHLELVFRENCIGKARGFYALALGYERVILGVLKGKRNYAEIDKVCRVDPCKGLGDDRLDPEV